MENAAITQKQPALRPALIKKRWVAADLYAFYCNKCKNGKAKFAEQ